MDLNDVVMSTKPVHQDDIKPVTPESIYKDCTKLGITETSYVDCIKPNIQETNHEDCIKIETSKTVHQDDIKLDIPKHVQQDYVKPDNPGYVHQGCQIKLDIPDNQVNNSVHVLPKELELPLTEHNTNPPSICDIKPKFVAPNDEKFYITSSYTSSSGDCDEENIEIE